MIKSKSDLSDFLRADFDANKFGKMKFHWMNARYKYLRCLRKYEYVLNTKLPPPIRLFFKFKLYRLSVRTGIQIPPNTFGKGLYIPHHGTIVVNETARLGDYCVVQAGVNISEGVVGGNHIYLGTGSKLMKGVYINNYVIVGANAVVTKTINVENVVIAGIPAKIISKNGFLNRGKRI